MSTTNEQGEIVKWIGVYSNQVYFAAATKEELIQLIQDETNEDAQCIEITYQIYGISQASFLHVIAENKLEVTVTEEE